MQLTELVVVSVFKKWRRKKKKKEKEKQIIRRPASRTGSQQEMRMYLFSFHTPFLHIAVENVSSECL